MKNLLQIIQRSMLPITLGVISFYLFYHSLILIGQPLAPIEYWSSTTPLHQALASQAVVANDEALFVIGGKNGAGAPVAEVRSAIIQADGTVSEWNSLPSLPVPLYLHTAVATTNAIYVVGGWDGQQWRSDVWRATFSGKGQISPWRFIKNYPTPIVSHDAVIINNRWLYVIGGENNQNQIIKKVYFAEIVGDGTLGNWQAGPDLPRPLFRLSVATFNNVIYIAGGFSVGDQPQAKVYYGRVDPNSGALTEWPETSALLEARFYHKVTVHDGRLVVLGGKKDENTESAQVYSALIKSNGEIEAWKAEPALPESRYRFAAVAIRRYASEFIYVLGGLHDLTYRDQVYHSALPPPPTPTPVDTPTPTPTATPTPTIAPTPTPGMAIFRLDNQPKSALAPGEEITYMIHYENGPTAPLNGVVITNPIPNDLFYVPNSAATQEGVTVAPTVLPSGNAAIVWKFTVPISTNVPGNLSYRVQRATPTPIPTGLGIVKTGPRNAKPGADILYYLRVTNYNTTTIATHVVITDRLPVNATYVTGGVFDPEKRIAQWDMLTIAQGATMTQPLVIRADETIVNADYGVKAEGGEWIKGYPPVTTIVGENVSLPPVTTTDTIINEGAFITWQGITTSMMSNPTYNPGYTIYLPLLWR